MTIYQDSFVFRMAPWIMTPNTLKPKKVFVAEMKSGDNSKFINELKQLVKAAGVPLEVVGPKLNKRDRWMQVDKPARNRREHIVIAFFSNRMR